ncbi:hypothetical protein [Bacillus suaedaesalsae]|uniref:Uncharacterized protein n=1 Tax=Bacillus suaedaesalsae TaxID=2810349 RepID=A0ABS2DHD6_9BACI|nr:hypothetical protein [Bacillus suaedaesalsae]MBM6617887.1 hypothetical protein [Bacillus suaedaesalsae]
MRFIVLFITSVFIVISSPVWKQTKVTEMEQLQHVPLGFPFSFMNQSTSLTPMPSDLPIYVSMMDIRENGIDDFSLFVLTVDVFIVFYGMYVVVKLLDRVRRL